MKTVVTHASPDLDACVSVWLIKRFLPNWQSAQVVLVDAGSTLDDMHPDENKNILHVDTGLGIFDHHQSSKKTSAARKVFDHLKENVTLKKKDGPALDRIVDYVTLIDNFGEVYFPEASADIHEFSLARIIDGLKTYYQDDQQAVDISLTILDSLFISFKNKINAEDELENGHIFNTKWGKGIAVETKNDEVMSVAVKNGFVLAVRKDPKVGYIRIKSFPRQDIDLTEVYKFLNKEEPEARWFLHSSKNMLFNGPLRDEKHRPSKFSVKELIEIMNKI
jgi:hypothetical protein